MNDQTDVLAARQREEEVRRREEAQEADRRRLQQIIHDDERHALEQKARRGSPALAAQPAGALEPAPARTGAKTEKLGKSSAGEKPKPNAASDPAVTHGIGLMAPVVLALVIGVSCFLGWKAFQHWKPSTPAGTAAAVAPATDPLPTAIASPADDSKSKVATIDPPVTHAAASAQPPTPAPATAPLPVAATPDPKPDPQPDLQTKQDEALPSTPETPAGAAAAGAAGNVDRAERAGLPDPAPAPAALAGSPVASTPAPVAEAKPAPEPPIKQEATNAAISARLDRLEAMLTEIRDRVTAKPPVVAAAAPAPAVAATPEKASREKRAPTVRKVTPAKAVPAISNGQLLAVDMWNGVPSVVVGTGLPGDKRVRVLKRGDVYNGVALIDVDPVARTATFGLGNGRSFTLSANQGG